MPDFISRCACKIARIVILLPLFAACPAFAQPSGNSGQLKITVVLSEWEGPYLEFSHALDNFLSGKYVRHTVIDANEPVPPSRLVIAVGLKAATAAAASNAQSVLNVLVTKAGYQGLLHDFPLRTHSASFSAIYLDQPFRRQARLIATALPGKHNVGILYSTPPENLDAMRQVFKQQGLALQTKRVKSEHPLPDALSDILERSEILLALPDAAVYNGSTIRNILLASYRQRVPLIGFSAGYVTAGALCAVTSTPEQIAHQAAALITQFEVTHALPPPQYPDEFEVMLNQQVARSLGLRIKPAAELHDKISKGTKEAP